MSLAYLFWYLGKHLGPVVQSIVNLTMLLSKGFVKCFGKYYSKYSIYEPPRDKTNKVSVRQAMTQISLGIRYKLSSCGQRRLVRLGGCPGWSESSLGARPHCWFCHVAAHICWKYQVLFMLYKLQTIIFMKYQCSVRTNDALEKYSNFS